MAKLSLAKTSQEQEAIKIHHDYGDFKMLLVATDGDQIGWVTEPELPKISPGLESIIKETIQTLSRIAKVDPHALRFSQARNILVNAAETNKTA